MDGFTLQSWSDGVGQSEVPTDFGADPGAVEGTSTLVRPEWSTGLKTHSQSGHMRTTHHSRGGFSSTGPEVGVVSLTTKLPSLGLDVSVIPSLILSFLSDTLSRESFPGRKRENFLNLVINLQTLIITRRKKVYVLFK